MAVRPAEGGALLQEKGRRSRDSSEDQRYQIGAEVWARRVRGKTEALGAKQRPLSRRDINLLRDRIRDHTSVRRLHQRKSGLVHLVLATQPLEQLRLSGRLWP